MNVRSHERACMSHVSLLLQVELTARRLLHQLTDEEPAEFVYQPLHTVKTEEQKEALLDVSAHALTSHHDTVALAVGWFKLYLPVWLL